MHRSTSRASKQRRELIKTEIDRLRELLPLPNAVKARLSFLHVMSLGCVFVRKGHYFNQQEQDVMASRPSWDDVSPFDFTQALHGFLLMMTRQGKLLYISENVTDYLGHSMVELLSTGGDLYEVIDPRDHTVVRAQMAVAGSTCGTGTETESQADEDRTFFCRMNTSRNMRRKDHCTDNKMVRIKGRFRVLWSGCCYNWNQVEPVFTAVCSPVETLTPISDEMVPLKTSMFTTEHGMDMVIYDVSSNVFFHLGYESSELSAMSWYTLIHPDYVETARKYHQQMLQPSIGTAASRCAFVLRLLRKDNTFVTVSVTAWLDRDSTVNHAAVIMCQNLVIREDEIAMYESQALHETLARRSAPCLVSPRPPSASGSSERFSCGPPGDDGSSPWPEQGPRAEENTPCSVDTAPLYGYTSSGGQTHRYVGDSTPYQYLVNHGDRNDWRYDSESCYYQENQFNTMSCQLKVENAGWDAQIHRLPHHEAAGREFFPGNYGPYSSVLLGPARARQSVRPRKDGVVDGCDVTMGHTTTRESAVGSDPCPALKRAVLEWARRLKVKRQIMTSYKKQEQCFPSLEYKEKSRKRSHRETSVPASPVPLYKSEIDYAPCVATLTRMEPPAKRFMDGTIQVNNQPHTVNNLNSQLQNPEEPCFNSKGYTSSVGIPQVEPHWWPTSGREVRVPDSILTPESSPSHEDPPGKMRLPFGTSSACSPESSKPSRQQDDRHASDKETEPVVGTLEDAVGKALCALSSDELRLLDQATLSLLYQNGPSRQPSFPKRTVANSDNK